MGAPPDEIGGEIEASIPWEIKHAEDIALMAQMGVRWDAGRMRIKFQLARLVFEDVW